MLNPRHEAFCVEFLKTGNATEAYYEIYGGNKLTASRRASVLLRNQDIKDRIKELTDRMLNEKIASAEEVMEYLTRIIRGQETEMLLNKKGDTVKVEVTAKDRLKACELMGKRYGLYTEKVKVDSGVQVVLVDDLRDEERD